MRAVLALQEALRRAAWHVADRHRCVQALQIAGSAASAGEFNKGEGDASREEGK